MKRMCCKCIHWESFGKGEIPDSATCRRYPPVIINDNPNEICEVGGTPVEGIYHGEFPTSFRDMLCGEFQPC